MSCPTVQKCCGCIGLETAGITMGVLDIIIRVSHAYIILNTEQRDIYFQVRGTREKTIVTVPPELLTLIDCLCFIITIVYLLGIFNSKRKWMIPSMVLSFASAIVSLCYCIAPLIDLITGVKGKQTDSLFYFIFFFCIAVFFVYFLVIQYSLYKCTKEGKKSPDTRYASKGTISDV
ncbi:uncharacterized protein LOC129568150 [Sitodiplosis mosellana]|uniref:uncharacterized protein LOC129568150 n=1 Tax=Sitodiplosis mosellana TaxID=263140 RepID=UPI0024448A69|nr:uncharacterized protein LOC129568150 [Sitodiplosis mosellana]